MAGELKAPQKWEGEREDEGEQNKNEFAFVWQVIPLLTVEVPFTEPLGKQSLIDPPSLINLANNQAIAVQYILSLRLHVS